MAMSAFVLRASSQSGTLGFESLQNGYSMHCISSALSQYLAKTLCWLPGVLSASVWCFGFGAITQRSGEEPRKDK